MSGLPTICIPPTWRRRRLRFEASINPVKSELNRDEDKEVSFVPMEAVGEFGGLVLDQSKLISEVYNGYTYFTEGDVCIAKITPCFENGKGALADGFLNGIAFGTTELHIIRPSSDIDKKFLFYLTIAHDFRSFGASEMLGAGGQKRVPERFLKDWMPPLPPLETQRRIAAFLDEKTARIDGLIAKKRALLERLAEKRQALITQAVTKGLNPHAPMKPSGIDWLGEIPEHWQVKRLKFFASLGNGSTPKRENPDYWKEGDIPWLNSSNVNLDSVTESDQFVTSKALAECHLPLITPPAILIGITGQGRTRGMATTLLFTSTINQHIAFVKPRGDGVSVDYLRCLFDCAYDFLRSESEGGGSTKGAITCEQIAEMAFPIPPLNEQDQILKLIQSQDHTHSETKIHISLNLLTEYRSALITAAVTGQIAELL